MTIFNFYEWIIKNSLKILMFFNKVVPFESDHHHLHICCRQKTTSHIFHLNHIHLPFRRSPQSHLRRSLIIQITWRASIDMWKRLLWRKSFWCRSAERPPRLEDVLKVMLTVAAGFGMVINGIIGDKRNNSISAVPFDDWPQRRFIYLCHRLLCSGVNSLFPFQVYLIWSISSLPWIQKIPSFVHSLSANAPLRLDARQHFL